MAPNVFHICSASVTRRAGPARPAPAAAAPAAAMGRERPGRGARSQGGPPAADAAGPDDMGPKRGAGAPKESGEEEARTCCGCRFPLLLALLQLALGIAVTVVGFLMAGISSSLLVRDTPFWAGIIVSIESVLPERVCHTGMPRRMVELPLTHLHAPFPGNKPLTRARSGTDARRTGSARARRGGAPVRVLLAAPNASDTPDPRALELGRRGPGCSFWSR